MIIVKFIKLIFNISSISSVVKLLKYLMLLIPALLIRISNFNLLTSFIKEFTDFQLRQSNELKKTGFSDDGKTKLIN